MLALAVKNNDTLRRITLRTILTLLLSLGLALPVLSIFGLLAQGWLCVGAAALLSALLGFGGWSRTTRAGAAALLLVGGGVWLAGGGWQQATEIAYAMVLHLTGLTTALPLMASEAAVLITLMLTLLAYLFTHPAMGPASVLLVAVMTCALWMSGTDSRMLLMLPSLAATATILACSMHGEGRGGRVLPWMVLLAAAACLLAPPSGVTIPPLRQAAEQIRQTFYDYFYFNQSRTVFSLANEGYYPQGSGQLGGAAEPTDHPVMLVETSRRVYLRGVVKDSYTGRSWLDTVGSKRYLWVSPARRAERSAIFDLELPPEQLQSDSVMPSERVTVTMLDHGASTLFVPQRIRSLYVGGDMVPYFNDASEVFITRDLAEGDTYTVLAPLTVAGDPGLDAIIAGCDAVADHAAYQQIQSIYTRLPDHLQSQVFTMAHTAAGSAATPYEQAMAVQSYLRSQFRYTLNADYQPGNVDFVANFLLNSKKGYCTHFASAMTVLCRILGLPARYVEGYLAEPAADGVAYVTGMEAHAWTEIYFAGFGWLTFDATPPRHDAPNTVPPQYQLPDRSDPPQPESTLEPTPSPEPDEPEQTPEPEATPEPDEQLMHTTAPTIAPAQQAPVDDETHEADDTPDEPEVLDEPPDLRWLWYALIGVLLLALAAALLVRILRRRPKALAGHAADDDACWQIWAQAVHDQLYILRLPRRTDESPQAWLCRLADEPELPDLLALLGEMENYIVYGRYVPCAEEVADTMQIYEAIYERMKPLQRVRLLLMRAFVPEKRRKWYRG